MKTLVFIILCLVWGSTWMAIKMGLQDAPPIWASGFRMTLAGLLLLVYNLLAGNAFPQGWKHKWRVAWPGIPIYFFSYVLVYIGAQYITSALTSILFAGFPFFIIIMVPIFIRSEKIMLRSVFGVLVGFAGIIVIFAGPINMDGNALASAALVVMATFCSAYGTIHIKAFLRDQPIFPMMAMQMALAGLLSLIVAFLAEDIGRFHITTVSVGSILYLATFGSILTFSGYFWLLPRIHTVKLSLVTFISPIVAVFLGYIFLNETLSLQDYIGSALVLGGVLLTASRN